MWKIFFQTTCLTIGLTTLLATLYAGLLFYCLMNERCAYAEGLL
jgi:hypothetical protein